MAVDKANEVRRSTLLERQRYGNSPENRVGVIIIGLSALLLFTVK
jgi:hypothetical protein